MGIYAGILIGTSVTGSVPSQIPSNVIVSDGSVCKFGSPVYALTGSWTNTDSSDQITIKWYLNSVLQSTRIIAANSTSNILSAASTGNWNITVNYNNAFGAGAVSSSTTVNVVNPCM